MVKRTAVARRGWSIALLATCLSQSGALGATPAPPQIDRPTPEDIEKAEMPIRDQFKALQAEGAPPLLAIRDGGLARSFPSHLFFAVIFRQYPVARLPPKPLKFQNLFVVQPDGKVQHVTDTKELDAFFRSHLRPATDDGAAKDAARAWLRLSEELKQDGFYKFAIPADSLTAATSEGERKASGIAGT